MHRPWHLVPLLALGCAAPHLASPRPARAPEAVRAPEPVTAARRPPALSGGTLLITRDGRHALASDPERDRVWMVRLGDFPHVVGRFRLRVGDEPGRLAEDAGGRVHVVLRRGGAVLSLDVARRRVLARREVCPAPRGVATRGSELFVACAGGALVSLPTASAGPVIRQRLPGDLRDVGVDEDGLWVSRFRSAELIRIGAGGPVRAKIDPLDRSDFGRGFFAAHVAWRTRAGDDGVWMLHQREQIDALRDNVLETAPYYGHGVVVPALTRWRDGEPGQTLVLDRRALAIDIAPMPGGEVAVVFAGDRDVAVLDPATGSTRALGTIAPLAAGQPVAVETHPRAGAVIQYRERPALVIIERPGEPTSRERMVNLGPRIPVDVGHRLFHRPTSGRVACASCHPEGGDDGHVWRFEGVGPRRTQALGGSVLRTAPFHWEGDLATFADLLAETYTIRMGGGELPPYDARAVATWVDSLPVAAGAEAEDPASVRRGRALFEDPAVGCATCHAGADGRDGRSHDVGTGGSFQTPPLTGIAGRPPYFHDGCAETLRDRFDECHTEGHGELAHLSAAQIADLAAYVSTR